MDQYVACIPIWVSNYGWFGSSKLEHLKKLGTCKVYACEVIQQGPVAIFSNLIIIKDIFIYFFKFSIVCTVHSPPQIKV